jgi:hypothetical protein
MKITLLSIVASAMLSSAFAAAPPKITDAKPQNGVFVTNTGYMTTVLELKDGKFRYWFQSDSKSRNEPKYPLAGDYSVINNRITLKHDRVSQKHWTFLNVDGFVTLWRPDALKMQNDPGGYLNAYTVGLENFRRCGTGAILILSDRPAELTWKKPRYVEVAEEQHRKLIRKKTEKAVSPP